MSRNDSLRRRCGRCCSDSDQAPRSRCAPRYRPRCSCRCTSSAGCCTRCSQSAITTFPATRARSRSPAAGVTRGTPIWSRQRCARPTRRSACRPSRWRSSARSNRSHRRHRLRDLPIRGDRPRRLPLEAQRQRGGGGDRPALAGGRCGVRPAAAGSPWSGDPHRHLRGGGPHDLGRDRPDRLRPARPRGWPGPEASGVDQAAGASAA